MTKSSKGGHKNDGKRKGQSAKFQKKEYNAPLKYVSEGSKRETKKVKLDYYVAIGDKTHFYNEAVLTVTEEKTAAAEVELFDDGTEGQFLVFKRNLTQTIEEVNLEPSDDSYGAKHLYSLTRKAVRGHALDTWLNISRDQSVKSYGNFKEDLWKLTNRIIDDDATRQQKKYLEKTKKPRKMTSKQWLNRICTINTYLPEMKKGQKKYSEEELIEKVVTDNIPDSWVDNFELLDGPKATTILDVQLTLQKIERCENNKNSQRTEKSNEGKGKKSGDNGNKNRSNPCRIEGHDHDWKDCPNNWRNKKKGTDKPKNQENNLILAGKKGFFSSESEEEESSDEDSIISQESFCVQSAKLVENGDSTSGEILLSVVLGGVRRNYTCLLDTGTSQSLLSEQLVDEKAVVKSEKKTCWETKGGKFSTSKRVVVKDCKLPQFTSHRKFDGLFHLFEKSDDDQYDAIIGRDLLGQIGIDLIYSTGHVRWGNISVPMVPMGHFSTNKSRRELFRDVEQLENKGQETFLAEIKKSKYEAANLVEVANNQSNLDSNQKGKFYQLLKRCKNLFLGKKGKWKGSKVSIELKEDAKPVQSKPYKVPQAHVKVFKEEIDRLVDIGLFTKVELAEWSSPTFCIPKKDGRIRIVTDYRKVNKCIKRKPHPLPNIMDTIMTLGSFKYATCIDLNMGYYAMEMDDLAKKICTIVLPWGFYQYNMLPMGVVVATDIFQARLGDLLGDLQYVVVYLDDILIIGNSTFKDHLQQIETVLIRLLNTGM